MFDQDPTIRRRADGTIDTAFYTRRAAALRRGAQQALLIRWGRSLAQIAARLAGTARPRRNR